jgi:glycosyltransferase involved in cell wall biosynthesis
MKVAYIFLPGRIDRIKSVKEEDLPTEFFYGAIELRKKGYSVDILEAVEKPRRSVIRYVAELVLRKKYLPIKTHPSILDAVWLLLPRLKEYDAVVATTTGVAFALVFWKMVYRLPFSVVGIMNSILNYPLNIVRTNFSRILFKRMNVHLFGEGELNPMCQEYKLDPDTITVNYFGVDTKFWVNDPGIENEGYLLAVGNDSMRDFATLLEVAKCVERPVYIVTKREITGDIPANVTLIRGAWHSRELDDIALRDMYRKAFAVIVPLKESFQPSGQSVTLQAMACGKPVVLTNTAGLWERNYLKNKNNILLVEPGKSEQIVAYIKELEVNSEMKHEIGRLAREYVLAHGQIEFFSQRLENAIAKNCKKDKLSCSL